jgi:hydroxyacylglutathione hydrolase
LPLKKYLLIGGATLVAILLVAVGGIYAVLKFGVLPLRDGTQLGDDVVTVVTGDFGPVAIGAYVVKLADGGIALIDAGMDANGTAIKRTLARMGKAPVDVRAIFCTHGHNDHATGALAFPAAATYVMPPDMALVEAIRSPDGRRIVMTRLIYDGDRVDLAGTSLEVFGVPGHTAGSAAFLAQGVLFLGDSAASISDGTLQANTMLAEDANQTERSLLSLAKRLSSRRAEIHHIAFAHQGPVEGLDPLLNWASTRSQSQR